MKNNYEQQLIKDKNKQAEIINENIVKNKTIDVYNRNLKLKCNFLNNNITITNDLINKKEKDIELVKLQNKLINMDLEY